MVWFCVFWIWFLVLIIVLMSFCCIIKKVLFFKSCCKVCENDWMVVVLEVIFWSKVKIVLGLILFCKVWNFWEIAFVMVWKAFVRLVDILVLLFWINLVVLINLVSKLIKLFVLFILFIGIVFKRLISLLE